MCKPHREILKNILSLNKRVLSLLNMPSSPPYALTCKPESVMHVDIPAYISNVLALELWEAHNIHDLNTELSLITIGLLKPYFL